jgi:GH18 family chitinase
MERRIAYYQLSNVMVHAGCNQFYPEDLHVAGLTHINVAFVNFEADFQLVDIYGELLPRLTALRTDNPALHICIAVGGWDFNEGETADYWSKSEQQHLISKDMTDT